MIHKSILAFVITAWSGGGGAIAAAVPSGRTTTTTPPRQAEWPFGPFTTSGRDIVNANNETVVFAGVNWSGHGEVMIPEGLQYSSIEGIVSQISSIGLNSIRLTYAIQMVDEIYANSGQDITVQSSFISALGTDNGTAKFQDFLAQNPSFSESTTRLEVFDAVAAECARQGIYIDLDNHMSRASWCCSTTDGNAWFGDTDFVVSDWLRGLSFMADHASTWESLVSMSLRNELRTPEDNPDLADSSYNWQDWYEYVTQGAQAIHSANSNPLILLSGLDFDTWLTPVVRGTALTPGEGIFDREGDFPGFGSDKLVLELHNYENEATDCDAMQAGLYEDGYEALHPEDDDTVEVFPVVMTEFGFEQDSSEWEGTYFTCLADLFATERSGWMQWTISGSYYVREGEQDMDETWGLLDHEWKGWRDEAYVEGGLVPLIAKTLEG